MTEPAAGKIFLHASCVALGDAGILILGPSGAGKSDLVLGLIDQPGYGTGDVLIRARLVSDDQTMIDRRGDTVFAMSPEPVAGLLEIRGQGIVAVDHVREVQLTLVVRLVPAAEIERLPEATTTSIAGVALSEIRIDPGTATAAARIRAALTAPSTGEVRQNRQDVA
jgi:HPr kinase/phosphorylase